MNEHARIETSDDVGSALRERREIATDAPHKVWLVGEHNPYSADPEDALYPLPEGATGARICSILGLDRDEYLRLFRRANLLDDLPWSAPRARAAAREVCRKAEPHDKLVLLGSKVAAAFGVAFKLDFKIRKPPLTMWQHDVLVIPHPSGRSRAWNDPRVQNEVRVDVLELCTGPTK